MVDKESKNDCVFESLNRKLSLYSLYFVANLTVRIVGENLPKKFTIQKFKKKIFTNSIKFPKISSDWPRKFDGIKWAFSMASNGFT